MKKQNSIMTAFPVLFGFFVMGFCDIVGISSDYVQRSFNWSPMMTGFVPSMVFVWFLFLGIPIGNRMNKWGRKNTVLVSMVITIVGMIMPLLADMLRLWRQVWKLLNGNLKKNFMLR